MHNHIFAPLRISISPGQSNNFVVWEMKTIDEEGFEEPHIIYDLRGDCTITINGVYADRENLFSWFCKIEKIIVDLVIDDDYYGHVAEAHFREKI